MLLLGTPIVIFHPVIDQLLKLSFVNAVLLSPRLPILYFFGQSRELQFLSG
jgi:hypothetical protein